MEYECVCLSDRSPEIALPNSRRVICADNPGAGAGSARTNSNRAGSTGAAITARHLRVLKMQSLRSGISPIAMALSFFSCKASASDAEAFSQAKGILYWKALRTVSTAQEGLCRLLSEPTPSPRLCISAKGATPQRTPSDYHALAEGSIKTGTFYFAGNRNFLLCLDSPFFEINTLEDAGGFNSRNAASLI
jgi:hypothetical protein